MRTVALLQRQRIAPLAALCCMAVLSAAQVNVTTYHYNSARTGQNTAETVWTPARNSSQFGKLFSVPLDGYVYAQPLYLANVTIAGETHNVLYVANEHDSVYGIDADSATVLWQQNLINPSGGITSGPSGDGRRCRPGGGPVQRELRWRVEGVRCGQSNFQPFRELPVQVRGHGQECGQQRLHARIRLYQTDFAMTVRADRFQSKSSDNSVLPAQLYRT